MKFDEAKWQLEGTSEPGLYPVEASKRPWHLDAKRPKPVLQVKRKQIPLVPAFAVTAHSSQGKTLSAVLLDLNIDKRTDANLGTVAASRVRTRHDVLILRPFPIWLFQRGAPEGPRLLLQTLRGQEVDWSAYQAARRPAAVCQRCNQLRAVDEFSDAQWDRVRANHPGTCLHCLHDGGDKGPLKRKYVSGPVNFDCVGCKMRKIEDAFPRAQLVQPNASEKQRCLECVRAQAALTCSVCRITKDVAEFAPGMITLPDATLACKTCQENANMTERRHRANWFTCRGCKQLVPDRVGGSRKQQQYCANCASGSEWKKGEQTCRKCGKKFKHERVKGSNRVRHCPECSAQGKKN